LGGVSALWLLSDFATQNPQAQAATIANLRRYHINGLQFYDWQDRHDQPLTLVAGEPSFAMARHRRANNLFEHSAKLHFARARQWNESDELQPDNGRIQRLCNPQAFRQPGVCSPIETTKTKRAGRCQAGGNLTSNSSTPTTQTGKTTSSAKNRPLPQNSPSTAGTSTSWVLIDVYDYSGNSVDLASGYASLLTRAKTALTGDLVMNAVDDYGQTEITASHTTKFAYEELWDANATFADFLSRVETNWSADSKKQNTVFAAYINRGLSGAPVTFNAPGVILADAAIFAAGASHLELGEHMLANEYFPNANLTASSALMATLRNYYDFDVAYENLLRGSSNRCIGASQCENTE
jgi:dextranase